MFRQRLFASLILLLALAAAPDVYAKRGPKGGTVLIIRHAEKPADKDNAGLSPAGRARAAAYPGYFREFRLDGQPIHIDYIFGARQTPQSDRPHLTLQPLAESLHLPLKLMFENERYSNLATDLITGEFDRKTTL